MFRCSQEDSSEYDDEQINKKALRNRNIDEVKHGVKDKDLIDKKFATAQLHDGSSNAVKEWMSSTYQIKNKLLFSTATNIFKQLDSGNDGFLENTDLELLAAWHHMYMTGTFDVSEAEMEESMDYLLRSLDPAWKNEISFDTFYNWFVMHVGPELDKVSPIQKQRNDLLNHFDAALLRLHLDEMFELKRNGEKPKENVNDEQPLRKGLDSLVKKMRRKSKVRTRQSILIANDLLEE